MRSRWQNWITKLLPAKPVYGNLAAWALVAFGILLRARQYLFDRSLWIDEAMLAVNIVKRPLFGLAGPLEYGQRSPLGFLAVEKWMFDLFGPSEPVLRSFPFIAGCIALVLACLLARRLMGPAGQIFVLAMFAVCDQLIFQSVSVKQYSIDVMVVLALYLLAIRLWERKGGRFEYLLFGPVGILALWVSQPAPFTLAGIGAVETYLCWKEKDARRFGRLALAGAAWLVYFGLTYVVQYSQISQTKSLTDFWGDFFMPLSPAAPAWVAGAFHGILINPAGFTSLTFLAYGLFLVGIVLLARKDARWTAIFVVTLLLTITASAVQKYPFGARTALFLVPGILLAIGKGIDQIGEWLKGIRALQWIAAAGLTLLLIFPSARTAFETFASPKPYEHIRPTMQYLAGNYKPGDIIFLYFGAEPAFRFYAARYGLQDAETITGADYGQVEEITRQLEALTGNKRVWVLFSHVYEKDGLNDRDTILAYLNAIGDKKREFRMPGTSVYLYLYDLGRP